MATAVFTTWAALRDKILDNIQNYSDDEMFKVSSYTQPDGVSISPKNMGDLLREYRKLASLAAQEADLYSRNLHRPILIRQADDK